MATLETLIYEQNCERLEKFLILITSPLLLISKNAQLTCVGKRQNKINKIPGKSINLVADHFLLRIIIDLFDRFAGYLFDLLVFNLEPIEECNVLMFRIQTFISLCQHYTTTDFSVSTRDKKSENVNLKKQKQLFKLFFLKIM